MTRQQLSWDIVDPLGVALRTLRVNGTFYCQSELSAPWGLTMPTMQDCMWFHAITDGECELAIRDNDAVHLQTGDFVLVTHGHGHVIRSTSKVKTPNVLDLPHEEVSDRFALLRYGGGGKQTSLVCGIVRLDHYAAREFLAVLPALIHVDAGIANRGSRVTAALRLMADEVRQVGLGGESIVTRLADILVIEAIRSWLSREDAALSGWLAALKDGKVGRALAMIHREPGKDWTVELLAKQLAMSRSAFAARFSDLVGESPIHYAGRLRMRIAADLLANKELSVSEIALRLGYKSSAAFSRAFKRFSGVAPKMARGKSQRASSIASQ